MIDRRTILRTSAALAAVPVAAGYAADRKAAGKRKTYLLVHGAFHGGWCWGPVAALLRQMGHVVYAPSLTGLGDRYHLRSPEVNLNTHIEDLTDLIDIEDLRDIVIVAHSYGGYPVTGACDRRRDRIAHAVYMDAGSPENGDYNAKILGSAWIAEARKTLIDGYLMDSAGPGTMEALGIPADNKEMTAWVAHRLRPHPFRTWVEPIQIENGGSEGLPRTYAFGSTAPAGSPLRTYADLRRADPSYTFRELSCGHDMMVVLPQQTAEILAAIPV